MGQIRFVILIAIIFAFATASCQKIEPGKNKILFPSSEEDVFKALHRMEFFMNKFPNTFRINCMVDHDGYLYLNNQKIAPLYGAVKNPKVRKDMVFESFKEEEIDEFFKLMTILLKSGVDGWSKESSIGKFLYSYNGRDVRRSKDGRDLMIVNQQNDTTNINFKNYFTILDRRGDVILISLKDRKEWK